MAIEILPNQSLVQRNSLGVAAIARCWLQWRNPTELAEAHSRHAPCAVLAYGEGTNLLLRGDISQLCLHSDYAELEQLDSPGKEQWLSVGAGKNWNQLVENCLANGWYGLENLIAIPGSCGAAPVQNIGAYGAELADNSLWMEYFDWQLGTSTRLMADTCQFAYRDSLFKRHPEWIITRLGLRLTTSLEQWRNWQMPRLAHSSLASVQMAARLSPPELANAVARLRAAKLPDPCTSPNAGSFFHNPIVNESEYAGLLAELESKGAAWRLGGGRAKLSAAWLIEQCVRKGYRRGRCGLAANHALCLVNYEHASGEEIYQLAVHLVQLVRQRFGVRLHIEPKVIGSQ